MRTSSRFSVGTFSVRCSTTSEIAASGTPTKKHQRQPSAESTMIPPSSGPPTTARDMIALR